jgi:hypothetical protein
MTRARNAMHGTAIAALVALQLLGTMRLVSWAIPALPSWWPR